ncbi:hypothetical protein CKO44_08615 [Rubrivivax gelatinosus]|uniref:Lipopolysaccharide assembly protein A domain-containing protein n=1 Tax=Rubrivivax gelatinosus TaxID=28068 RepID=A0ABS1DVC3_RUBGE|nr:hypothetical protein [Rubrivivax gelatinosus]MBK1713937.1 hypothetical protein [Rubrivivax gelatinosus]
MRLLVWLFRAFVFFTLFAFALNNQQNATVRWFFGVEWQAPMVIVVLIAFAGGCAVGVLAMLPSWWRQLRKARRQSEPVPVPSAEPVAATPSELPLEHPPREGL